MKVSYNVYKIVTKTVCVPSEDYYSREGDWQTQELATLILVREFNEEQHAVELLTEFFLEFLLEEQTTTVEYTIIKTYKQ